MNGRRMGPIISRRRNFIRRLDRHGREALLNPLILEPGAFQRFTPNRWMTLMEPTHGMEGLAACAQRRKLTLRTMAEKATFLQPRHRRTIPRWQPQFEYWNPLHQHLPRNQHPLLQRPRRLVRSSLHLQLQRRHYLERLLWR